MLETSDLRVVPYLVCEPFCAKTRPGARKRPVNSHGSLEPHHLGVMVPLLRAGVQLGCVQLSKTLALRISSCYERSSDSLVIPSILKNLTSNAAN